MNLTQQQVDEVARRSRELLQRMKAGELSAEEIMSLIDEVGRDILMLALTTTYHLKLEEDHQTTWKVLSEENVRLNMAVTTLALQLSEMAEHMESVSEQLRYHEEALERQQDTNEPVMSSPFPANSL